MPNVPADIICIPKPIECPENPDLENFPQNVLFASVSVRHGKTIVGTACYEPVLKKLYKAGDKLRMEYKSAIKGKSWLIIEYDTVEKTYFGKKFVDNKDAGKAVGKTWEIFFQHFTALGLADHEKCEMKRL